MNYYCVQCGKLLKAYQNCLLYCNDPKCPGYGLFQIGVEKRKVEK